VPSRVTQDLMNDLLHMPLVQELVSRGRTSGSVTSEELRDAVLAAEVPASSHEALLTLLSEHGVDVAGVAHGMPRRVEGAQARRRPLLVQRAVGEVAPEVLGLGRGSRPRTGRSSPGGCDRSPVGRVDQLPAVGAIIAHDRAAAAANTVKRRYSAAGF